MSENLGRCTQRPYSSLTVHRSPLIVHRSSFIAHRSLLTTQNFNGFHENPKQSV
ncbi:MAG: hypothetical protein IIU51_08420 [Bacteroidaceae bacterium]|nr:hypothetical protein [Bacteroidaceae bacterium]